MQRAFAARFLAATRIVSQPRQPLARVLSANQKRAFLFSRGFLNNNLNSEPKPLADHLSQPVSGTTESASTSAPVPLSVDPDLSPEFTLALDTVIQSDPASVAKTITAFGDIQAFGLGGASPIGLAESLMEAIYVSTGLPWWATIATCTIFLRVALFPFVLKSQIAAAKMQNLKPLLAPIQKEMELGRLNQDLSKMQSARLEMSKVFSDAGVSPFAGLWGMAQLPVFVSMFFGIRAMADAPLPGFENGGFLWFNDLSLMDPYYIMPLIANATMLIVLENGMEMSTGNLTPSKQQMMKTFFRGMLAVSFFFTASFPAAVFVYWVTTNFLTLIQHFMLQNPTVKQWLGIPKLNIIPSSAPVKAISAGVTSDGLLAIKPMKMSEAIKLAKNEADRRKIQIVGAN